MSGILDNKSRVLDTIVTLEGRRQIASANLRIEYVSFTDAGVHYSADVASGSSDATKVFYLEQCHLPQDQITFESDDSGRLMPFRNSSDLNVKDGRFLQYEFNSANASLISGTLETMSFISGSEFQEASNVLLASSVENLAKLRIIGSADRLFDDEGFGTSSDAIEFVVTDKGPITDPQSYVANVDHVDSLFQDIKLSKLKNFEFLPPINKTFMNDEDKRDHTLTNEIQLGRYKPWGRTQLNGLTGNQLERELSSYEKSGFSRQISFDPTTSKNSLLGQFFEVSYDTMKKLDVIDFGHYIHNGKKKHAFFIGKLSVDNNETHVFTHIFTLVFG